MSDRFDLVSPCVSVCTLDPVNGWCQGCLRTAGEIAGWSSLDYDGKRAVLERLHERRQAIGLPTRRQTRRSRARAMGAQAT